MQCEVEQSLLFEKWVLGAGVLSLPQPNDDLFALGTYDVPVYLGVVALLYHPLFIDTPEYYFLFAAEGKGLVPEVCLDYCVLVMNM